MAKLPASFYTRDDTVKIAKELLGKSLVSRISGKLTSGMIVETEAYLGSVDRACHAFNNRRTPRTEVMFSKGGVSYVYLCYGIHELFNVVTNLEDKPHAILIRAVEPLEGIPIMLERKKAAVDFYLCAGPGSVCQALGIHLEHSGLDLGGEIVWIEDAGTNIAAGDIISSKRVGVESAGADGLLPLRFRIAGNKWVSKAK